MLFWPFSEERFAASIVSIVDPLLTVPAVLLVIAAGLRRSPLFARLALGWICFYLTMGAVQHHGAERMATALAESRGHTIERLTVKPSFGNILIWRSVYEARGKFYVDGMRVNVAPALFTGPSVAKLNPARDFPWLDPASQQYRDLLRFDRFSQGYTARDPGTPNGVIDVRFSFLPNAIGALWSIALTRGVATDRHVEFQTNRRNSRENLTALWRLITADPDR